MERPVRVLMVTPEFHPHLGGVETHTLEVARRLAQRPDIDVRVLTTDRSGLLPSVDEVDGVPIERVQARPRSADLYWAPAIGRKIRSQAPDIVHCQGYHTFVPIHAMLAARRVAVPYVVTFHSGGHSSRLRHRLRPVQVRLLRPLLARAAALVAVSQFEAQLFHRMLGSAGPGIRIIPNGIDLASPTTSPVARDPGLIVSVGRLERYKGHERMIRALPFVRATTPDARLQIVGQGPYADSLRRIAREEGVEDVVAIGPVARGAMATLLRSASVAVLLSEYESQGLGAHEALAAGCRLVVTDSTALRELSDHPAVTAISASADAGAIAAAVNGALHDASAPVEDAVVRGPVTWDECAERIAALYEEVASSRRS